MGVDPLPHRFKPARLLAGRHLQTIFGPLTRKLKPLSLRRERWELDDGDFVDVDRLAGADPERLTGADANPGRSTAATLVVLHGLEGSSSAHYVQGMLAQAQVRGWSGLALNFRGCSGELNRLLRSYHSGETGDLRELVRRMTREAPGRPLLFVGCSLGGNVLVKWLGEEGSNIAPEVKGAVAISVPFDLAASAAALDGPGAMAWVYRTRFLRTLTRKSMRKAALYPGAFDVARLRAARTLREFDDVLTSHIHGFAGAADYYAQSSSGPFVARVRTSLLLLSAEDDPFIPATSIPRAQALANSQVKLEVHAHGGHLGFVEGSPLRPRYFAERRALEFLEAQLNQRDEFQPYQRD